MTAPKYTSLSGSPLPLFHAKGRLSYGSYGRTARLSRSQLKARNRCLLCTPIALSVVLTLMLFRSMSDSRDAKKLLLPDDLGAAAERAAPVMSRADALAAMYAPASLSSHRARAASSERCAQRYTLMLIADSDAASRDADADGGGRWHSSLKRGTLCRRYERAAAHSEGEGVTFSVEWEDEVALHSRLNSGERGMELSELIWFEGRLLACDDRTGIVYHISAGVAHPRLILSEEADESAAPSLKCEWMSVRRGSLYVGGVGHEYRDATGHLRSTNQLVKVFEPHGNAPRELNWTDTYGALERAAVGSRGYLIHEAVLWDERADEWLFAPRRASVEPMDPVDEETRGSNLLLWAREHGRVRQARVHGALDRRRGYSSLRWLPSTPSRGPLAKSAEEQILVALKTEEVAGETATYLSVFRANGVVLLNDTYVGTDKYEGLEVAIDT